MEFKYEGLILNGVKDGEGTLFDHTGKKVYEGFFL